MLRKISLSAMTFTYFFAGLYHFTRFDYFCSLVPPFIPFPPIVVTGTGALLLFIGFMLAFRSTRRLGCYLVLLMLAITLPIDGILLVNKGMDLPLPFWVLVMRVPFHLLLMGWAWSHLKDGPPKDDPKRQSRV